MKTFFRMVNDTLYGISKERLGFNSDDPSFIPDEYLDKQKFMVMRTCHGIGDWALLSAMPRLLKQKYPDSKVYIPSRKLLKKIFGDMLDTWGYGTFDVSTITELVFQNNPYVDGFVDEFKDEVFHDHYKIYDPRNDKIPVLEQMLKFWQFDESEIDDTRPEFYLSDIETKQVQHFKKHYSLTKYGYISVSSTFEKTANSNILIDSIKECQKTWPDMKWLYYGENPLLESSFTFLNNVIEVKNLNLSIREQQSLKVNADYNFGNETGMNLWTSKYSKTYVLGNTQYGPLHGKAKQGVIRKYPFKSGNFVRGVEYL